METRVRNPDFASKIMDPAEAIKLVPKQGVIAFGGMAGTGYPKAIPAALAALVSQNPEGFSYSVLSGGSCTADFDQLLLKMRMKRRYPFGASSAGLREIINSRQIAATDSWLYEHARWVRSGLYARKLGQLDVAVVEVSGVTQDGLVIPSLSVDASASFIRTAKKVIFEVNSTRPFLEGLHDIALPVHGEPTGIRDPLDRIGTFGYKLDPAKVGAVVISEEDDTESMHYSSAGETDLKVVEMIATFLISEVSEDENLRSDHVTIQPGAGPVASALARRIAEVPAKFSVWGEVVPTSWIPALSQNIVGMSGAVLYCLPGERKSRQRFYDEFKEMKSSIVLRPYEIANNSEMISRFRHVVIQQAIEVDIYGHVNVSHIGNNLYGGVGGSGDHTRSAYLTIIGTPSVTGTGKVSRIVPIVSHTDIPEHDVDILVTEQGVADLRCLAPIERAKLIIERCAHPRFKEGLLRYYESILKEPGHQPVNFMEAARFSTAGSG